MSVSSALNSLKIEASPDEEKKFTVTPISLKQNLEQDENNDIEEATNDYFILSNEKRETRIKKRTSKFGGIADVFDDAQRYVKETMAICKFKKEEENKSCSSPKVITTFFTII